jgi:hypothetical protein
VLLCVLFILCCLLWALLVILQRVFGIMLSSTTTSDPTTSLGPSAAHGGVNINVDAMDVDLEAGVLLFPGEVVDGKQRAVHHKM